MSQVGEIHSIGSITPYRIDRRIARQLVHKAREENVFISDIEKRSDLGEDVYECYLLFEKEHSFFFEHALDHVPGLLIAEALRQMGTAVSHIYFGIKRDQIFIIDNIDITFQNLIETSDPILLRGSVYRPRSKQNGIAKKVFRGDGVAIQNGKVAMKMESCWRCIPARVWQRLRVNPPQMEHRQ